MRTAGTLTAVAVLISTTAGETQNTRPAPPDRRDAFVAATRMFAFHSDPTINLHDFLLSKAQVQGHPDPRPECLAGLPRPEAEAFEQARLHYDTNLSRRPWTDRLIVALRYEVAGFTEANVLPDSATAPALEVLRAAVPAYRRCWWKDHDARNRAWIAAVVPRLIEHEDAIAERLGRVFKAEWKTPFPVDIVGDAPPVGANTVTDPDHILISSADTGNQGTAGLEIVFHEAGHTIVGPGGGEVWQALQAAAAEVDAKPLAGQLWHPIIFYTAGKVVEARLAERGAPGYEPYMFRGDLFRQFRQPLEQHWQPYVDNRISLQEAAKRLLGAVKQNP